MKLTILLGLSLFIISMTGDLNAQMHKSGGESTGMHQMMNQNMIKMAAMMEKMSQALNTGKIGAEHQKRCAEIMNHMSDMMSEMGNSYDDNLGKRHEKQLNEDDVFLEFLDTRYTN